ncbi:acyltransferase family protein [Streptomyces tanashiensis]
MADAKVIPFDDDRSRARRRPARAEGEAAAGRALPGPQQALGEPEGASGASGASAASGGPGVFGGSGASGAAATEPGHGADAPERAAAGRSGWERRLAGGLAFLRRRVTGEYEVDEFGYDEELTDQVLMSLLRPLYEKYFRVEVKGVENIPAEGGALIVANHSGTLPLDGLMMQVAVHDHHPAGRHLRLLAADLVFVLPVVNELARKAGHTLACAEDAERLLRSGEVVGVMPEGFKGIGKPFGERYKLQRFGRGGFVSTALRAGCRSCPARSWARRRYTRCSGTPGRWRGCSVSRTSRSPRPSRGWGRGALPLPTKWTIQFGEPIPTDSYAPEAAEDPMLMFNLTDQVREQIQHTLYKLLVQRRSVFF